MSVGEANKKEGLSRSLLWAWAAFLPLGFLALAFGIAYAVYRADTVQIDGSPWRLLAAVAWLPYTMLAHVVVCYMSLSLRLAPAAAREALIRAATAGTGLLMIPGWPVVVYGRAPAFIAFGCALAVALAGLLALWVWLDRTYRAVDYYLPS